MNRYASSAVGSSPPDAPAERGFCDPGRAPDPPPFTHPSRKREALAILRQAGLMARQLRPRRRPGPGNHVVAFVHGFMASGAVFDPMREVVERSLDVSTTSFSYGMLAPFHRVAERLAEHLEASVPSDARLSLVGHSMGGLLSRWYLQERARTGRVDRIVTLATPHAGTESARLIPLPMAVAMRPGSDVLRRLAAGRSAAWHVPHTAVVAGADRSVPPESAACVGQADIVRFEAMGHNEILFDPRVYDVVVGALR